MTSQTVYLKPNVIVEPLFNQWYAWSYLIAPATAARYITESHLKIMQSFVEAPQVHQSALKRPEMMGGPFINYGSDRVNDIQALLEKTKVEQAPMLHLSQAISTLDQMLSDEARGYSLEPLYQKVPEALKGYVELVYDANNHPSIRFIEGLLYKSQYYNPSAQTIALSISHEDTRSFVLSTPRLKDPQYLHLPLAFNDSRLDRLFQMRSTPQPYNHIKALLEISEDDDALFSSFFTTDPLCKSPDYSGSSVRVRYFGHACVLIETKDISILCDPLISYQYDNAIPRYTYADLPETIDYVLITHNHQDHCMFETLLQLRHKIKHLVVPKSNHGVLLDPSLKLLLKNIGFSHVWEIDELETIDVAGGQIMALPFLGEHGDLNICTKAGFLVHLNGKSILCLADSNNIEPRLYEKIHKVTGDVQTIFIGMECEGAPFSWAYGPLLRQPPPRKIDATRRLDGSNAERAIELVSQFNPQQVYVYAMGQEPWLTHITSIQYTENSRPIVESNQLVEACRLRNIKSERLFGRKEILLEETATTVSDALASSNNFLPSTSSNQPLQMHRVIPSVDELVAELDRLDIRLGIENDRLRCNAPKGTLTPDLKAQLSERKAEILEFLRDRANSPTPSSDQAIHTIPSAWLTTEAVLDPTIHPDPPLTSLTATPDRIFLTGATGFFGAFLLNELLQQTQADIYCLVRAQTPEVGQKKLQDCLKSYTLWNEHHRSRIVPVIGDLSQPLLGLSDTQFQSLAEQMEAIYHNGAWVHHTSPYSLLKPTNVLGTQEVLRLAGRTRVKPVHFMSATSVFAPENSSDVQVIREQDRIDDQLPWGGYSQSKWVAERLVTIARDRGIPVSIYRLGRISGHSQTGVFNPNDFLYRLMIGCVHLGSAPDTEEMLDMVPVDYASQAIVHLSQQSTSWGKTFHVVHPQPVSSAILLETLRSMGYTIQSIPYDQWRTKLLHIAQESPEHALYPLVSLFPAVDEAQPSDSAVLKFDCQNTLDGLSNLALTCPPIDTQLLHTYFSYLIQHGFLRSPLT